MIVSIQVIDGIDITSIRPNCFLGKLASTGGWSHAWPPPLEVGHRLCPFDFRKLKNEPAANIDGQIRYAVVGLCLRDEGRGILLLTSPSCFPDAKQQPKRFGRLPWKDGAMPDLQANRCGPPLKFRDRQMTGQQ